MPLDLSCSARRGFAAALPVLAFLALAPLVAAAPQEPPPDEEPPAEEELTEQEVTEAEVAPPSDQEAAPADEAAAAAPQQAVPAEPVPPPASDLELAQVTMGRLLAVGHALHSWVRDTRLERGRRQMSGRPQREVRWNDCPPISHADLAALLVPAYLRELPEEDAWGRPIELCLDRRLSKLEHQYGVRSAGADGEYQSGAYALGGFAETALGNDLVWMDGAFVRWPAAE